MTRAEAVSRVAVAIDISDKKAVVDLARSLAGHVGVAKIGLEAFTAHGPGLVAAIAELGLPVFLDLKLHDIPNTVERAARSCAGLGVRMLTVHAAGGEAMLRAAVAGATAGAAGTPPIVVAVTVLTSLDDDALTLLGIRGTTAETALAWAVLACKSGCGGIVCSAHEVASVRTRCGAEIAIVTPGIRPRGEALGDQRRVATPTQALAAGASLLVVGRPITGAIDPVAAADAIVDEIMQVG
jgi:orotidine-5'-phosphate decarboxylase